MALDQGMKEIMYLGKEVKNSWGTVATTDRFIKEQPEVMLGFMRAVLKALRVAAVAEPGIIEYAVYAKRFKPRNSFRIVSCPLVRARSRRC